MFQTNVGKQKKGKRMKVKLTKVYRDDSIEGGLRTNSIIGVASKIPQKGEPFVMMAEPLEFGDVRYIETSEVTDSDVLENIITFHTQSGSIYTLEVLGETDA